MTEVNAPGAVTFSFRTSPAVMVQEPTDWESAIEAERVYPLPKFGREVKLFRLLSKIRKPIA